MSGGALFVFANKRATRLKVLWFERNGFCLLYKRLHQAVFELPAAVRAPRRCTSTRWRSRSSWQVCRRTRREQENARQAHARLDSDREILHSLSS